MHRQTPDCPRALYLRRPLGLLLLTVVFLLCVSAGVVVRGAVDPVVTGNVWKIVYGVTDAQLNDAGWLAADDDGDGISNGAELIAGTNPFSSGSTLNISSTAANPDGSMALTFPTAAGKFYSIQMSSDLSNWAPLSPALQVMGDGSPKTLTAPAPGMTQVFYRVNVQDIDTDGDGVSDWAEIVTGFDPNNAHTHGASQDDHAALVADLVSENVVTITATKASATQPVDAMTAATDPGTISVVRGGTLHFNAITVPLVWSGTALPNVDYAAMPATVTFPAKVGAVTLTLVPLANANRRTSATATARIMPGPGYATGASPAATVAILPPGNANGTGLTGNYYNSDSATIGAAYNANNLFNPAKLALSRTDAGIDFIWTAPAPIPGTYNNSTYYTVAWAGQVQPQYSETYYFDVKTDDGVKLWVNGQLIINGWSYQATDRIGSINLQGGVLYDIRMEYYQAAGTAEAHLYWYSNSRTRQIVPANRLYPLAAVAPPAITSPTTAVGFEGQPFSYTVTSSVAGVTYGMGANSGPLPPGLSFNPATGLVSGTPTAAGDYQVALTATNANGVGALAINFQILPRGSGVTRELWQSGVAGTALADVPFDSAPTSVDTSLTTLEDNTPYPAQTGERLRGYFTAPATGNYYFWVAANNAAEFWLSDDAEPVNKIRRAWVTAPGSGVEAWTTSGQTRQRSPWLSLTAGQKYYYEVRHNTGTTANSGNLAVGWLLDPTGAALTPATGAAGVVPGYVLGRYDYPAAVAAPGALYVTNLSPQGASTSTGVGSANLRLSPGNTQAILHFSYSGLTSPRTAYHIHTATDGTGSGPIVFDLDDVDKFHPELKTADGGYIWNIVDVGTQTAAQIVSALQQGFAYFNVHTVNFPNGEIRGNLGLVQGSQNPPAFVPDPGYPDDHGSDAGAARFLNQAAFGASPDDLASVKANGYAGWINLQTATPMTDLLADLLANPSDDIIHVYKGDLLEDRWWRMAVTQPDQLRQRVAFALSEILVVSSSAVQISDFATSLAQYNNVLASNAFGNFRDVLKQVTLNPTMGYWLNMQGNGKGNITTGLHPNENYAREIMQLFSVGLNRLWPDGSFILDSNGDLVPTYSQDNITGMARVFTGWNWYQSAPTNGSQLTNFNPGTDWVDPMSLVPSYHELGPKNLLDNVVLPAATGTQTDPTNAACNAYAMADLDQAIDNIFYHPNLGPFICRQLIQRLVTSSPSPAYLYRVSRTFDDDGSAQHVRGNLGAVVRAILLDGEARDPALATAGAGKQREPVLRLTGPARTFPYAGAAGTYAENGSVITVTLAAGSPASRLASGDAVGLDFNIDTTGSPAARQWSSPTTGNYTVLGTPAPTATSFSINQVESANVSYTVIAQTGTPPVNLTVKTGGPTLIKDANGNSITKVYLQFLPAGSGLDGVYLVQTSSSSQFQVLTASAPSTASGTSVMVPKMQSSVNMTNPASGNSIIKVMSFQNHNLRVNDHVWLDFSSGGAGIIPAGEFTVSTIIDPATFTIVAPVRYARSELDRFINLYALVAPPITRTGKVGQAGSKWDMGGTDGSLGQTPYASATVFNFFAPDYKYPGSLAAANVTTPEFQLTTDSEIVNLTNTLNKTFLYSNNPNGLCSFNGGSIVFDLSPFMAVNVNDNTALTNLINKLGDLLTGGQLTAKTKAEIFNYITGSTIVSGRATPNFLSTSSTNTRDRVRAIVQLILISPEYAVQR